MISSIRHLRADTAEWQRHDIVIPDGELAIERTQSGGTVIKLGNGKDTFSSLPSIFGQAIRSDEECIEAKSGYRYFLGTRSSVYIVLPSETDDDFTCEVSFRTRNNIASFGLEADGILLTGDGTADNLFIPEPNTHYTMFFWCEGGYYQGVVRGAPYET